MVSKRERIQDMGSREAVLTSLLLVKTLFEQLKRQVLRLVLKGRMGCDY